MFEKPLVAAGEYPDEKVAWFNEVVAALTSDPRPTVWGQRGILMQGDLYDPKDGVCRWCGADKAKWPEEHPKFYCSMPCYLRRHARSWGTLRYLVAMRDGGRCQGCGQEERLTKSKFMEVHHIVEVASGGLDHPDNLKLLCKTCHAPETTGYTKSRRSRF